MVIDARGSCEVMNTNPCFVKKVANTKKSKAPNADEKFQYLDIDQTIVV